MDETDLVTEDPQTESAEDTEDVDDGVVSLFARWYTLRDKYDQAMAEINEVTSVLNDIAGFLKSKHGVVVPWSAPTAIRDSSQTSVVEVGEDNTQFKLVTQTVAGNDPGFVDQLRRESASGLEMADAEFAQNIVKTLTGMGIAR